MTLHNVRNQEIMVDLTTSDFVRYGKGARVVKVDGLSVQLALHPSLINDSANPRRRLRHLPLSSLWDSRSVVEQRQNDDFLINCLRLVNRRHSNQRLLLPTFPV